MKPALLTSLWAATVGAAAILFLSADAPDRHKAELPMMQSFSATPRFESQVEIFGQTLDLSRWDLHERYERELTNMCYTHNNTLLTLKRANRYFPLLIPILRDEGIPEDFIYLACIESSMNPRAYSPAKAAGIWQFIGETGRRYGLQIDGEVDERYHMEKAARAACRYLKEAYEKFGDWITVAASYNAGQAGISRRLTSQDATTALDCILADETSRYMFRIMAMKEIMRDPYHYGFVLYSDQLYRPIRTREVKVTGSVDDWAAWARRHDTNYYQLKEFNPWLRDNKLTNKTGKTYIIQLPVEEDMHYDGKAFPVYNDAWVVDR